MSSELGKNLVQGFQNITSKNGIVLGAGYGTGSVSNTLIKQGYTNLYGHEHSAVSVERRPKLDITMHKALFPAITFDNNTFDVVIAP